MILARTERAALADLFAVVGPAQPTMCAGWDTGDLMAHLLMRERRPDGMAGLVVPRLAGWTDRISQGYRARPWAEQVALLRSGPHRWNPISWGPVDAAVNGGELFIHHEDVRRGGTDWQPRDLDSETAKAVDGLLTSFVAKAALRKVGVGVTARVTDPGRERDVVLKSGAPMAIVSGPAAEILLWASGRSHVKVARSGAAEAIKALDAADLGV